MRNSNWTLTESYELFRWRSSSYNTTKWMGNDETKQTYEHMQVCGSSPINSSFFSSTSIISVNLIHWHTKKQWVIIYQTDDAHLYITWFDRKKYKHLNDWKLSNYNNINNDNQIISKMHANMQNSYYKIIAHIKTETNDIKESFDRFLEGQSNSWPVGCFPLFFLLLLL